MSLGKKLFLKSADLLPLPFLNKKSAANILLPYHHSVSNNFLPHISHLYSYKNEAQFVKDILFLKKYFEPIHPDALLNFIEKNNSLPKNKFLLSFDDGFREVHDVIAPILKEHRLPALIFINPKFIDNGEMFYRNKLSLLIAEVLKNKKDVKILKAVASLLNTTTAEVNEIVLHLKNIRKETGIIKELAFLLNFSFSDYLHAQQPYLTLAQLQSLKEQGFTIGGHSYSHPYYSQLNLEQQINETNTSMDFVQTNKLCDKRYFSFPHSDAGLPQNLFTELKKNTDLLFGIQNQKLELENKMLHRFNAERPGIALEKQVKGILLYSWANEKLGKNTIIRS